MRQLTTLVLFLLSACSTPKPSGLANLGVETIAILGTNDIHGAIAPIDLKTREKEGIESVAYQAGGLAYLASTMDELRAEYGDHLLWLDAGDEFQGTIESNSNFGAAMVAFFNAEGLNAAAIGNHEFDYGASPAAPDDRLSVLKSRLLEAHYPYLAANVLRFGTDELANLPNTRPSTIFQVGKVKVGVIGLSTIHTPTTTRPENVASLHFGALKDATLTESKSLRAAGADLVVVISHAGVFCDLHHGQAGSVVRKPSDPQGACEPDEEIYQLLKSIPSGTVDAVVSGHTHTVVHHWIAGVPVIQGGSSGRYLNVIQLRYSLKDHKLLTDETRIEGPIPICPMVFANQGDCNGDRPAPATGRGALVKPVFHGKTIGPDARIAAVIEPAMRQAEQIRGRIVGQAARPIDHERRKESPLGNLISDALRDAAHSDFALVNSGGIRTNLEQGPINYGAIFRVLPFDNTVMILHVTGAQLKNILRVGESGSRGFHPVSGLKLRLVDEKYDAPAADLDGDGKIEPWETNRLIEVKSSDGQLIDDRKTYTLATIDFLVSGGDDYGWAMGQIPALNKQSTGILMRDAVAAYIQMLTHEQGSLNSAEHPLLDPASPRLVFEKPKDLKKKHRKRRKPRH